MSYQDILPLVFAEIVGDFGYKAFANKGGITNFTVGTAGYVGVIYYLIRSLQGSQILLVNPAWDGLSALIETIAAFVFLGERFNDPWRYVGVFLIVVGLFFLRLPVINESKFVFPKFVI
jgi:multidrug transporter EmrE-like cation transporter